MNKKNIAVILGTRPEAIKLIPVYRLLKMNKSIRVVLINTGQHKEMLDQVLKFFNVKPDYDLDIMRSGQSLSSMSTILISSLEKIYKEVKPYLVLVQGDTASCFFGGMVAYFKKIKIVHLEAGLRTNDKYAPFPEEGLRHMLSCVTDLHFAPTEIAKNNLLSENIVSSKVYVVGNTVIDSLFITIRLIENNIERYRIKFDDILNSGNKNILVTSHRRENQGEGLLNICNSLLALAKSYEDYNFIFPVHRSPEVQGTVNDTLQKISNIKLIEPLPYDELIFVMDNSYLILSDSGGIQEEAPSLNKPVLILRDKTERPEGVNSNCSTLVGNSQERIVSAFDTLMEDESVYNQMKFSKNPYGDGKSAKRIVSILNKIFKIGA